MALKDMSLTPEEAKEQDCCAPSCGSKDDGPKYPWGLQITLDDDSLEKLGFGLMPVGTEITIMATARVTGNRSSEREGGEAESSMDLQIVAMDLGTPQADRMAKSASKLYPDKS